MDGERNSTRESWSLPDWLRDAHRIDNRSRQLACVLILSTMLALEINEYPDSEKI